MAIRLLGALGAIDAHQERLDHIFGGTLDLGCRRTLNRDVFPHDLIDLPSKTSSWRLVLTSSGHRSSVVSTGTRPAQTGTDSHLSRQSASNREICGFRSPCWPNQCPKSTGQTLTK